MQQLSSYLPETVAGTAASTAVCSWWCVRWSSSRFQTKRPGPNATHCSPVRFHEKRIRTMQNRTTFHRMIRIACRSQTVRDTCSEDGTMMIPTFCRQKTLSATRPGTHKKWKSRKNVSWGPIIAPHAEQLRARVLFVRVSKKRAMVSVGPWTNSFAKWIFTVDTANYIHNTINHRRNYTVTDVHVVAVTIYIKSFKYTEVCPINVFAKCL